MTTSGGLAAFDTPNVRRVLVLAAVVGLLLGIETVIFHAATDPLADVHAYYDAGARLNAGLPLYEQPATTNEADFYRYPPLLAIFFRPLALLPFEAAAAIWMSILVACLALTIVRLGPRRRSTWLVMGMLALPTGWSLVIGQAQVVVTLLTAIGAPWAIALGANIKVFPALVAIWWVGRRDVRALGWFAAAMAALALFQFVLEPAATIEFLQTFGLGQVGERREPIDLRAVADPLGDRGRRRRHRRVAARADALGLAGCGRAVGPGHATAADLPAVDARRGAARAVG